MKISRRGIAVAGILACIIAGCGKTEKQETHAGQKTVETAKAVESQSGSAGEGALSWQASYGLLEERYDLALTAEDMIYGCLFEDGGVRIDRLKKEEISAAKTDRLPEVSGLSGAAADSGGNVYLLEDAEKGTRLWKMTPDGALMDDVGMELEDSEEADDLSLKGIAVDQRGYLYVWCEMMVPEMMKTEGGSEAEVWHFVDRVYVKDEQLNSLFYRQIDDVGGVQVLNLQIGTDGTPFFIVKDREGVYIQEIDVAGETLMEEVRLNKAADSFEADRADSLEHLTSTDNGFLYCQDNELFEFCFDTQKAEKILSLTTYGIFSSDILYLAKQGDRIEIIDNHGEDGDSEFICLALGAEQKKTLTLGTVMTDQNLNQTVAEFNRYSREYRVEIVEYMGEEGDYEDGAERLKLDIITGNAPDVLSVSGIDYRMLSEKGLLADLYDFMRNDTECTEDMLVRPVAGACEDEGRLYSVAPGFLLHSMWGYGDVTGGQSGVSFLELSRILESCGKDVNAIAGFSGDEPVLTRLCALFMDEFVDWEAGTCDFTGEYFKQILSFAKEYTGIGAGGPLSERIRKREVVLSVGLISGVEDYQIQKELYGGDIGFIGYPVTEGTGTAAGFLGSAVGINAKKEDPAGAWEFVKYYLLHGYDGQGFPMMQEQFDRVLEEAMKEETVPDGEEPFHKGYYNDGGVSIFANAATREEADAVASLVERVEVRYEMHPVIQNIINEEAEAYFAGQADLERTAEKIQNRVGLLLQETME